MLPSKPNIEVCEYLDAKGNSPYTKWFDRLNAPAAAKVTTAIYRMEQGNFSNVKAIGDGVHERWIDSGPGYRIYFGKDGDRLVILLAGGTKKRQSKDIAAAKDLWSDYKCRKGQKGTDGTDKRFQRHHSDPRSKGSGVS